ncbi:phosphatase PAP2 family protein [Pseudoroseicyclus aestuarii]|uniref:Autotransporter-associated beta strand protein n=1 Tax=Pseudoroseicyclus aestuarii TaxID=1795041 RepID=A0A318SVG3_9RHOB|nr:phosphatase PAP2 family protein [Pseudoroseicyclus aestuarii]PYE84316.1 autotransporter-associated beta strand protein [Pseudoroseicyclus aestuarii]
MPASARLAGTASAAALLCSLAAPALAAPEGAGPFTVPLPEVSGPLPVVEHYQAQAGTGADGAELKKYDRDENPIIAILSGFDDIWSLGDEAWRQGGANGDGAMDYSQVQIVDPAVWEANIAYVVDVTTDRSPQQALEAYLDDRRAQGFSVIEGMGPLAEGYREAAGATTTIAHELTDFDPEAELGVKEDDEGVQHGSLESELGDFVAFMDAMRGPEGSTSPAKYFYASPRPWRMNDAGEVVQTGTEPVSPENDTPVETYETSVAVVPALLSARETRGRNKDGGFPSGHTNAGYVAAYAYAYALPERYAPLLIRASELGNNRVVTGMHSPLDVIGGRVMATATAAAYLGDPRFEDLKVQAREDMLQGLAGGDAQALWDMAHEDAGEDRWAADDETRALYRERMTYGLPQDTEAAGQEMIVPQGAEVLLETRFPYLDADQRRVVLYSTGIDSGYPVLDESNGWGRLDLVAAAAGYGSFPGDVTVTLEGEGLEGHDRWENDIDGPGMLTKSGAGTLELLGESAYAGGTRLEEGTLVAGTETALGAGDLLVTGGTLVVTEAGLTVGATEIEGGTLRVDFGDEMPAAGETVTVLTAESLTGSFDSVEAEGVELTAETTETGITVTIDG